MLLSKLRRVDNGGIGILLKTVYFLLLLAASVEDYRYHTVKPCWTVSMSLLGLLNMIRIKENRWVTLALTCACFLLLFFIYKLVEGLAKSRELVWQFGGADVRLIPGMMLVQGWDVALLGVFVGLVSVLLYHYVVRKEKKEIPLVPWMSTGCFVVELVGLLL